MKKKKKQYGGVLVKCSSAAYGMRIIHGIFFFFLHFNTGDILVISWLANYILWHLVEI